MASAKTGPDTDLRTVLIYFGIVFAAQLALLIPQLASLRVPLRILPFGLSLLLTTLPSRNRGSWLRLHPAVPFAVIACCIVAFGLLNQETDSITAGAAQLALTVAIISPLFWVGRLEIGTRGFTVIFYCLWGFSAISSSVGVLQVLFPGHFQAATSSIIQDAEQTGVSYQIELADGTQTTRPYGLTDQPGGAATAGLTAFIFGLGLLCESKGVLTRCILLAGMGIGLFIMYLSQVRVSIVMSGVATIAFIAIMAMRGEVARLTGALAALAAVIVLSTAAAFAVGGAQTRERLFTLVDDNAGDVYYSNRGHFLDYTFNYVLPMYPLGAGLGRYGMMSHYFSKSDGSNSLWAEIQWTAWAYDGGWLLVICYPLSILVATWTSFNIGRKAAYGPVGLWGAIMTSYNISVIAVLFSYPFFASQAGLEWWLLNAAMFSAAQVYRRSLNVEVPKGFEVIPAPWRPAATGARAHDQPRRRALESRQLPAVIPAFDASDVGEGPS